MNNELSKVIVEMSINDTSVADIEISGFLSECAVATSLINNYMKQMFLLEYTDVPLTEFGYVQEASVSDIKDKIKTAASGAATAILNFLKKIGKLILNFFNWLLGKNKLENLYKKVDSMSSISMLDYEAYDIVNCFGGFLATLSIYENFVGLVTSMNSDAFKYEKLDRELNTLISVGTRKNSSEHMMHVFDDIIHSLKNRDYPSAFKKLTEAVESARKSAAETGSNRSVDAKVVISTVLWYVIGMEPIEKANKILLKSLNVNIDDFSEKLTNQTYLVEYLYVIAKKINRSYSIYQKKCVSLVAAIVKATEKENKKGTPKKSAEEEFDDVELFDDEEFDEE